MNSNSMCEKKKKRTKSDGDELCVRKIIFVLYSEKSHPLNDYEKKKKKKKDVKFWK